MNKKTRTQNSWWMNDVRAHLTRFRLRIPLLVYFVGFPDCKWDNPISWSLCCVCVIMADSVASLECQADGAVVNKINVHHICHSVSKAMIGGHWLGPKRIVCIDGSTGLVGGVLGNGWFGFGPWNNYYSWLSMLGTFITEKIDINLQW